MTEAGSRIKDRVPPVTHRLCQWLLLREIPGPCPYINGREVNPAPPPHAVMVPDLDSIFHQDESEFATGNPTTISVEGKPELAGQASCFLVTRRVTGFNRDDRGHVASLPQGNGLWEVERGTKVYSRS